MSKRFAYDVIIAGAGPAGAMCALACARAGLRTSLLEANAASSHGKTIAIEVEHSAFAACDLPEPGGDEIAFHARGAKTMAPSGKFAFEIAPDPAFPVKQEVLTRRLLSYAKRDGAEIQYGSRVDEPLLDRNCVRGVRVHTAGGKSREMTARVVVDATGYASAIVRRLPAECGIDFVDREEDRVIAEARLYRIDRRAVERAARDGRFAPEYTYFRLGTQGAYSTLGFMISLERETAFLLSGFKIDQLPPTPGEALDRLASELGCLTEPFHTGSGMIRIRRASLRLVGDGFATVGEAASMVVPMGASGVTSGMLAGRALGQHLGQVLKRGGLVSTKDLWPWCAAYQRGRGAVLASYDANRRVLETLDPQRELETLATSGVMTGEDMQRTFLVLPLRQSFSTLGARLRGGLRNPLLMAKLAPGFFRVMQVEAYWRRFPLRWDEPAFVAWKKTAERLLP